MSLRYSLLSRSQNAKAWLLDALSSRDARRPGFARTALIAALIFLASLGTRLFHWQDSHVEFKTQSTLAVGMINNYLREAERIVTQGGLLFPNRPVERGDARMIIHPPGYSLIIAALYGGNPPGGSYARLRLLQALGDSLACVLGFLLAIELLPLAASIIAGLLAAFSPHLAYYSLRLTPDSLAVLPVLLAISLLIRSIKRPRLITVIAAGVCLGISCWLRSNMLLLAPFLAVVMFFLFEGGKRLLYAASLAGAALVVILPITIRNYVVYDRLIPLSIGAGITMIEGIADYDTEQRFGMPQFDDDVRPKDVEWHNRPDYADNIWVPDGVERDQARLARGLDVIRSNPGWFLTVMARRAAFMLRYNESGSSEWPFNTARVPIVSAEPGFFNNPSSAEGAQEVWSASPSELFAGGAVLSPEASVSVDSESGALQITGDGSTFGDQFASAAVAVKRNTDYLLTIPVAEAQGAMAVKITSLDRRKAVASNLIRPGQRRRVKKSARRGEQPAIDEAAGQEQQRVLKIQFASGDREHVLIVISNDRQASETPLVQLGEAKLAELGPTPFVWTSFPRAVVRGVQKNLYMAGYLLPLVFAGIVLMILARKGRSAVLLLAVPLYFLCFQSVFHTEYRYILAIHYFLFVMAAVTLFCAGLGLAQTVRAAMTLIKGQSFSPP